MPNCVAKVDWKDDRGYWVKVNCGVETEPGYRYCDEHKMRRRAVEERANNSVGGVIDATEAFAQMTKEQERDKEIAKQETGGSSSSSGVVAVPVDQQSIFEKTTNALNKMIAHEEWTGELVATLSIEDLRYQDKAGAEQLHSYMALHERAMDRVLRAVTAVAKLDIDAQSVNANKMLRQMVKVCVTNTLTRMGMAPQEIEQARQILAEEFEKAAGQAS